MFGEGNIIMINTIIKLYDGLDHSKAKLDTKIQRLKFIYIYFLNNWIQRETQSFIILFFFYLFNSLLIIWTLSPIGLGTHWARSNF